LMVRPSPFFNVTIALILFHVARSVYLPGDSPFPFVFCFYRLFIHSVLSVASTSRT